MQTVLPYPRVMSGLGVFEKKLAGDIVLDTEARTRGLSGQIYRKQDQGNHFVLHFGVIAVTKAARHTFETCRCRAFSRYVRRLMDQEQKRKQSFLLRLPVSVREEATKIAHMEGTSLNHFIALALAEKISRMEVSRAQAASAPPVPVRMPPYSSPFKLHRTA